MQRLSHTGAGTHNATDESDFSHVNYRQAVTVVSEAKEQLMVDITERSGGLTGASSMEVTKTEVAALNNLLNEATLSLARILTKQGCVSAKFDNHYLALVRCWNLF